MAARSRRLDSTRRATTQGSPLHVFRETAFICVYLRPNYFKGRKSYEIRRTSPSRDAIGEDHPRFSETPRGFGPDGTGEHKSDLHRECGRRCPPVSQELQPGVGHFGVCHDPPLHAHPDSPGGCHRQGRGEDPRDPAAHRALSPVGGGSVLLRSADPVDRLRRDPG